MKLAKTILGIACPVAGLVLMGVQIAMMFREDKAKAKYREAKLDIMKKCCASTEITDGIDEVDSVGDE